MSAYVQVPCVVCGTLFWRPEHYRIKRTTCGVACRSARVADVQRRRWAAWRAAREAAWRAAKEPAKRDD